MTPTELRKLKRICHGPYFKDLFAEIDRLDSQLREAEEVIIKVDKMGAHQCAGIEGCRVCNGNPIGRMWGYVRDYLRQ